MDPLGIPAHQGAAASSVELASWTAVVQQSTVVEEDLQEVEDRPVTGVTLVAQTLAAAAAELVVQLL